MTIPTISTANYLFIDDTDDSWLAVTPSIWMQVTLSLSILTACIPSLKSLLDTLMASVAGAAMQGPFELTELSGTSKTKTSIIARSESHGHNGDTDSPGTFRGNGNFKLHQEVTSGNPRSRCYSNVGDGSKNLARSDSTRNLTEGVIVRSDQFEVQYEDGTGSSVQESLYEHFGRAT